MKSSFHFAFFFVFYLSIALTDTLFYPQFLRHGPSRGCNCGKSTDESYDHSASEHDRLIYMYKKLQQMASEDANEENGTPANVKKLEVQEVDPQKALACASMECETDAYEGLVCACNYVTGKVASFKNSCDMNKHNCRFDTVFKVILEEICPWEFQSRRSNVEDSINYDDPKYYN